jgi:hypothetical protein
MLRAQDLYQFYIGMVWEWDDFCGTYSLNDHFLLGKLYIICMASVESSWLFISSIILLWWRVSCNVLQLWQGFTDCSLVIAHGQFVWLMLRPRMFLCEPCLRLYYTLVYICIILLTCGHNAYMFVLGLMIGMQNLLCVCCLEFIMQIVFAWYIIQGLF